MSNLRALDHQLGSEGTKPTYLIQGEERLMVDQAVRLVLQHAIGDPDDAMSVTRLDLAESGTKAKDVIGACRAIGLFNPKTAVVVRAAEGLDEKKRGADRDELAEYADKPEPGATLILVATKLNGSSRLSKRIKKHGTILTFNPLKQREVPGWLQAEARALGHPMDNPTARLVGELVGNTLLQLRLVVDQLSLYVGPDKPITTDAVEEVLASTRAHSIFELVDAVGEKRLQPALSHLNAMLEHREQPIRILAMLMRHYRMLWQGWAGQRQGLSQDRLAKQLKLHPFQAKKLWAQSRKFDERALRLAVENLYASDFFLKSAGLDDTTVLERLVLELCA